MSDGSDASRLLARTFFAGACTKSQSSSVPASQPGTLLSAQYYVINIVGWSDSSATGKQTYQIESSEWYVFNTSDSSVVRQTPFRSFHPTLTNDSRIYGSKSVGFLAVHLKPENPNAKPADTDIGDFGKLHISYNVSIKEKQPINVQDLIALLQVLAPGATAGKGVAAKAPVTEKVIGLYGGGLIGPIQKLPDDITFEANVEFPLPPPPAAVASLVTDTKESLPTSLYRLAKFSSSYNAARPFEAQQQTHAPGAPPPQPQNSDKNTKSSVTCDQTLNPKTNQQAPCSFSKVYDDEGLYYWDVSVGVPVKALNELQFSSTDGSVTAKNVSRLNAYGFFDIYPVATDLKSPPAFGWPHIMVGLPFSGKVFNKPFIGSGGAVNIQQLPKIGPTLAKIVPVRFNFFGGVVYNKEFRPATLGLGDPASPGAVANNLVPHRVWKAQFGIEFSIRDVKDKLTASKKSSDTTNSKKSSSTANNGAN